MGAMVCLPYGIHYCYDHCGITIWLITESASGFQIAWWCIQHDVFVLTTYALRVHCPTMSWASILTPVGGNNPGNNHAYFWCGCPHAMKLLCFELLVQEVIYLPVQWIGLVCIRCSCHLAGSLVKVKISTALWQDDLACLWFLLRDHESIFAAISGVLHVIELLA